MAHAAAAPAAAPSQGDTDAFRRLVVVVGGLSLGGIAAGVLPHLGVSEAVRTVIIPGIPGLLTATDEALLYRRNSRVDRLKASLRAGLTRQAFPLALTAVLALLFFERAVLLLIGASGALTFWLGGHGNEALQAYGLATALGALFVLLPMAAAMVFVARYMAHRIGSRPLVWVLGVALVVVGADIAIAAVLIDIYNIPWDGSTLTVVYVAMGILMLAGGAFGTRWALREDRSYVMKRLFTRLPRDEQDTVIELVTPTTN